MSPGGRQAPDASPTTSRRDFLIASGAIAGGLVIGLELAGRHDRAIASGSARPASTGFSPNAFVRIAPDDAITFIIGKSEMGQGAYTGLAQVLAEELDVDPRRVRIEFAPVDARYDSPYMPLQFTGGSMSIISSYRQLREAGATARAMLVAAAAKRWRADAAELVTADGAVMLGSRRASYGELAVAASRLPPPQSITLKDPAAFRYIGKSLPRLDSLVKVTGRARFGLDVVRPDMLYGMVARAPTFGARVRRYDDAAARAIPGVVDIKVIPSGVAVLARDSWGARRGRDALDVQWEGGAGAGFTVDGLRERYRALAATPGALSLDVGDVESAIAASARSIDVEYEVPYLAHACMEPLNCVADVTPGRCEIWTGTQFQTADAAAAARAAGLEPSQVELHTQFLGGGFGRRANPESDFVVEAVHLARAAGRPVKLMWSREDDMRGGWYRPFGLSRIRAAIDADGLPVAWHHRIVAQPVIKDSPFAPYAAPDGIDPSTIEGISTMPYALPNLRVEAHETTSPVPVQWWRSVGHSHTGFVVNGALDELAHLGNRDPLAVRRHLLRDKPRHLAVLNIAAERAGWGRPLAQGHHLGLALQESFGSIVAQVAEVSVHGLDVRVHRVTCAVDCGLAVNPGHVIAQMESGIVYGLSAALAGEITFDAGHPRQGNFDSYPVLRIGEMPFIDTIVVPGDGPMGGAGEPGTPPIAAAVCNAIHAATGLRIRRLPITRALARGNPARSA